MMSSIQLRTAITAMIDKSTKEWKFCEYLPKYNSKKWDIHDGVLVLVLSGVHFSVLAMKKIRWRYNYICTFV